MSEQRRSSIASRASSLSSKIIGSPTDPTNQSIFVDRIRQLGLHDKKFYSKLVAQAPVKMFYENKSRNRKLISVHCKDLLKDCQKFSFSDDGKLVAAVKNNGKRISIMQLVEDSQRRLHQLVLIAICYRGFWSQHVKCMTFSPDNKFLAVTTDAGEIHLFYIDSAVKAKNNLVTCRKNELRACMTISSDQLLFDCKLAKNIYRQLRTFRIANKQSGNVSVPGFKWVSGLSREPITQRSQYVVQIASRWGICFELALYSKDQMSSAMFEGKEADFERAFEHDFSPDSYELINIYKLYYKEADGDEEGYDEI